MSELTHYGIDHVEAARRGKIGSGRYRWGSGGNVTKLSYALKMSDQIDLKSVNPYLSDKESMNCTYCTASLELLNRGYTVKAANKHYATPLKEVYDIFNADAKEYRYGTYSSLNKYMKLLQNEGVDESRSLLLTIFFGDDEYSHDIYARSYEKGWEIVDGQGGKSFDSLEQAVDFYGCSTNYIAWMRLDNKSMKLDQLEKSNVIQRLSNELAHYGIDHIEAARRGKIGSGRYRWGSGDKESLQKNKIKRNLKTTRELDLGRDGQYLIELPLGIRHLYKKLPDKGPKSYAEPTYFEEQKVKNFLETQKRSIKKPTQGKMMADALSSAGIGSLAFGSILGYAGVPVGFTVGAAISMLHDLSDAAKYNYDTKRLSSEIEAVTNPDVNCLTALNNFLQERKIT